TRSGRASAAPEITAPPPECPTSATGPGAASTRATTASTWSRSPIPERSASRDSRPGRVRASTVWPAPRNPGTTASHEEASSQNPGTRTMCMGPHDRGHLRHARATAEPRGVECGYYDRAECRSCRWLAEAYPVQLARKAEAARAAAPGATWLDPVASRAEGFRNKAKMVVAGTLERPSLGILDARGRGVDL